MQRIFEAPFSNLMDNRCALVRRGLILKHLVPPCCTTQWELFIQGEEYPPQAEFSRNGMGSSFWLSVEEGIVTAFEVMNGASNQLEEATCMPYAGRRGSTWEVVNNSLNWLGQILQSFGKSWLQKLDLHLPSNQDNSNSSLYMCVCVHVFTRRCGIL